MAVEHVLPTDARRTSVKCIGYAMLAMLGFGITNYLIGYATSQLERSVETYYAVGAEWKMMVILWLSGGVPGLVCYVLHWARAGKIEFFWPESGCGSSASITASSKLLTLMGGVGLGVSVSLMKKAFVFSSPADKGPITAIVGSTIIIVSLYGHFVFHELLSRRHALLIGIVLSMIGMAATTILIRYSSLGHVSSWSGYSARLLAQSALALVVGYIFVKSEDGGELPVTVLPNEVVTLSVIAGLMQSFGFLALNIALDLPVYQSAGSLITHEVEYEHVQAAQWQMMVIMWLVGGVPGLLCYVSHWVVYGRFELIWSKSASRGTVATTTTIFALSGGLILAASSTLVKQAFNFASPADKGPVAAIVSSTVVTVSLYGHFVFRELLDREHTVLIIMAVAGMIISTVGTYVVPSAASDGHSSESHSPLGFLFAILAVFGISALTLLMRYNSIGNVATRSGYAALLLSQSCVALSIGVVLIAEGQTTLYVTGLALVTTVVGGLSQSIGIFAMNEALAYPMTSLVKVICSANPVIVLLLNLAIDGFIPGTTQLIGMSVILLAVLLSALIPPKGLEVSTKEAILRHDPYGVGDSLLADSKISPI
ncbi:hypothetical protein FOZ60_015276 [Perkinsus olseni]|uniref:Uncharacterized protein n=1 Tax=Perkinsus olseni TaxID=32597 RepID=A0A7J6P614_PEROL|nr:hypothetical protein FOZ60_015276 [Perkinsus olseni]